MVVLSGASVVQPYFIITIGLFPELWGHVYKSPIKTQHKLNLKRLRAYTLLALWYDIRCM